MSAKYMISGRIFVFGGFSHVPVHDKQLIEHIRIPLPFNLKTNYDLQWEHPNDTALPVKGNRFIVEDGILAIWASDGDIPRQCAAIVFEEYVDLEIRIHANAVKISNISDKSQSFVIQI